MPTKPNLERFLTELAAGHTVKHAAVEAGIARRTLYDLREKDEAFAAEWQLALDEGIEVLEQEARRRAVEGTLRPVTIAGQRELVQEYSDALLQFLLKAKRPGVYREQFKHEHSGVVEVDLSGIRDKLLARLAASATAREAGAGDPE